MPEKKKRLFFALYPEADVRRQLGEAGKQLITEGKPSPIDNLHITLAFIGMADREFQNCLIEAASHLKAPPPFSITIDRYDYFQKARVLWLDVSQPPDELGQLHDELLSAIKPCGYAPENTLYKPHMTIARKYRGHEQGKLEKSISLNVRGFSLMESISQPGGVVYQELQRFEFAPK